MCLPSYTVNAHALLLLPDPARIQASRTSTRIVSSQRKAESQLRSHLPCGIPSAGRTLREEHLGGAEEHHRRLFSDSPRTGRAHRAFDFDILGTTVLSPGM
ncbi:hypothetical protein FA13DRAFT_1739346 [Coprinellus micaceus]|uniref:Uncharacterized protein n=1 Tax=Coprinellus micaceus TaxID=71717 RepID=A0A4Y7SR37_COPMI|nr:hypothetical protein FA13DRAFT_1739346 [Coprinellus micaceus]